MVGCSAEEEQQYLMALARREISAAVGSLLVSRGTSTPGLCDLQSGERDCTDGGSLCDALGQAVTSRRVRCQT